MHSQDFCWGLFFEIPPCYCTIYLYLTSFSGICWWSLILRHTHALYHVMAVFFGASWCYKWSGFNSSWQDLRLYCGFLLWHRNGVTTKKQEYVSIRRTKIIRIQVNYGEPGIADHEVSRAPHQPHNPRKNNTTTFWMFLFVFEGGVFERVIAFIATNFDGNLKANFHLQFVFCRRSFCEFGPGKARNQAKTRRHFANIAASGSG